jgi:uncharacterized protein (DUF4415 family)
MRDPLSHDEERWVTMVLDGLGRVLIYRLHLARRKACASSLRGKRRRVSVADMRMQMKREYDFSRAKRGPVTSVPKGKTRITIRLDEDIISWFRTRVEEGGGGNYQTAMNDALRQHIACEREPLEETLRRVVREEIRRAS